MHPLSSGVWGPYFSAVLPNLWLLEGGQSATGKLVDHVIDSHPASAEAKRLAAGTTTSVYHFLEGVLETMREESVMVLQTYSVTATQYNFSNTLIP